MVAVFSLAAVWLDPAERGHFSVAFYLLTAAYVVYALVMLLLVPRAARYVGRLQVVSQAIDIAALSAFIYFTDGPTSLFFVFFVFVVVTATLRWQWRGVLWTTLCAVVIFLGLGTASVLTGGEDCGRAQRRRCRGGLSGRRGVAARILGPARGAATTGRRSVGDVV